jgi:uncharacterized RDD family membrane protein YckC
MSVLPESPSHPAVAPDGEISVADPDRRFYAFAVDRLIAWGLDAAVAVAAVRLLADQPWVGVLMVASTVLVVGAAFALVEGSTGVTPGKALLGLRLVHTGTREPIGVEAAMVRTFVLGAAAVPFGFGLAALAWTAVADQSRMRRAWHDHLVSSIVVDTRPLPVVQQVEDERPRHVVNLTAMRLVPVSGTPEAPDPASVPARAPSRPRHAATHLVEDPSERVSRRDPVLVADGGPEPPVPVSLPPVTWGLLLDTGERLAVDTLVLVGRRPEPRPGEQGPRVVELPSADMSVSQTHAQVAVAADGALVITDRGSTNGSTLVRQGMSRPLTPGHPTTLLEGDVVSIGDRTLTVVRIP